MQVTTHNGGHITPHWLTIHRVSQ